MDMHFDTQALEPLFEMSRDGVIAVREGIVVYCNPAAETLLPIAPGDRADRFLPDHILSDPSPRFLATAVLERRSTEILSVRMDDLQLLTIVTPPDSAQPPVTPAMLNSLGQDLISVRLSIDGVTAGIRREQEPKRAVYAAVLYQSYYRIKRLYDHLSLLLCLRQGELTFKPRLIDLNSLCADLCGSVSALLQEQGVRLEYAGTEEECLLSADGALIETMLLNMLANSLLHTEGDGLIRMTLTRSEHRAVIGVDDRGSGIRPDRLRSILSGAPDQDPTDAGAGAGTGLSVIRGVAELHGGGLLLESTAGKGSRLRVILPLPDPKTAELHLFQPEVKYRLNGMDPILTELSVALRRDAYAGKLFD